MFCIECGIPNPENAKFCNACGKSIVAPTAPPEPREAGMVCGSCKQENPADYRFCCWCGKALTNVGMNAEPAFEAKEQPKGRFAQLPEYWQNVFRTFDQRPSKMQTHWNWPAFFFGALWYLFKGMPLKGLLYFAVTILTAGVGWLFLGFYAGLYGPWDYYLKEAQDKQLW